MKPIYKHDCDKCQYLRTGYYGLKESDFYHCDGQLIIRQSDEPSDYACYLLSLIAPTLKSTGVAVVALNDLTKDNNGKK